MHVLPSHYSLTLEQLLTAFAQVEAILNARPLTYVCTQPGESLPLTPNHFLYGSASQPLFDALTFSLTQTPYQRWNSLQAVLMQFAKRFEMEVFPSLHHTTMKYFHIRRQLQPGDVVTYFHPTQNKRWPLATIEAIFPGKDGVVRTIRLRDAKGREYLRDARKVALLLPADVMPTTSSPPLSAAAASCLSFRHNICSF